MSLAKICDRCGKYYKVYNEKKDENHTNGFILANIDKYGKYYSHSPIDLCMESLINWRDSSKIKNTNEVKDMRKKLYAYCNAKRCAECIFDSRSSCNFYALSEDAIQILYKKLLMEDENNESK